MSLVAFLGLLQEVLWLAIEVLLGLLFLAAVAPVPTEEVVVLALATHPAAVGEVERAVLLG